MNTLDFQIDAMANLPAMAGSSHVAPTDGGFASALSASSEDAAAIRQEAREAASQFVATAFIMPVLKMMHDTPFATEPFAPNSAQKRFMPMLDWQIADRVTSSANFPLVDRIVQQMTQHLPASEPTGGVDVRG